MKLELVILNTEIKESKSSDKEEATWYSRRQIFETENNYISELENVPISHKLDRMLLDDIQITSIDQIDNLIKLLENARPCFIF